MADDLRRAWAVVGLAPGSSLDMLRSRYRILVRRWHPDQFASDVAAQAEAAIQMRAINTAYQRLIEACGPQDGDTPSGGSLSAGPGGRRLSREEIERMVQAIGSESAIALVVNAVPHVRGTESLWRWISRRSPGSQWRLTSFGAVGVVQLVAWSLILAIQSLTGRDMLNDRLTDPILVAMFVVSAGVAWRYREEDER